MGSARSRIQYRSVSPYLKTSAPVVLGGVHNCSGARTLDTEGLPDEQVRHVKAIAAMLFLTRRIPNSLRQPTRSCHGQTLRR